MNLMHKTNLGGCLLLVAFAAITSSIASESNIRINFSIADSQKLRVRYDIPPVCNFISFVDQREITHERLRKSWKPLTSCQDLNQRGIQVTAGSSCQHIEFEIQPQVIQLDRIYPPAFPVGKDGVLVHTGIFSVAGDCGKIGFVFSPPDGGIVLTGLERSSDRDQVIDAISTSWVDRSYIYIGRAKPTSHAGSLLIQDDSLPTWLQTRTKEALAKISGFYQNRLQDFKTPTMIITHSKNEKATRSGFHGDVTANRLVRLSFFNQPSDQPKEDGLIDIYSFISHEFVHLIQSRKFLNYADPYLSEGGAEMLGLLVLRHLSLIDNDSFAHRIEEALNGCLIEIGDNLWNKNSYRNSGRVPYNCGLTYHAISLALRCNRSENALQALLRAYTEAKDSSPNEFIQLLACCGKGKHCPAEQVHALFSDKMHFYSGMAHLLNQLDIAKKVNIQELLHRYRSILVTVMFRLIQEDDCNGRIGFWTRDNSIEIDPALKCTNLKPGQKITRLESFSPFSEPLKAAQAVADACKTKEHIGVEAENGEKLTLKCKNSYQPPASLFSISASKLIALLE